MTNEKSPVIRYVNLKILFDFAVKKSPEAERVKRKKSDLIKRIDEIKRKINTSGDTKDNTLRSRLDEYYLKLDEAEKEEEYYRGSILAEIDYAVSAAARKYDIDYILNIGEGAVYARKEFDVTGEVLRIMMNRKKRSSPAVR